MFKQYANINKKRNKNLKLFRIILDADASSVVQRVALRTDDIPLGEQTVAQVIFNIRYKIFNWFNGITKFMSIYHIETFSIFLFCVHASFYILRIVSDCKFLWFWNAELSTIFHRIFICVIKYFVFVLGFTICERTTQVVFTKIRFIYRKLY